MSGAADRVAGDLALARDPRASLEERIAAGARLWSLIEEAEAALVPLKEDLRAEGRSRLGGAPGSTHLDGTGMTRAVVTVPKPSYAVAKGTDMPALKQLIGGEVFNAIFEEVVTYKVKTAPNLTKVASLSPQGSNAALAAIIQVDPTPRVAFKSAGEGVESISG